MVEEDFPSAMDPGWMIFFTVSVGAKSRRAGAGELQVLDHLLGGVLVFSNDEMNVIAHDRACVTCVTKLLDRIGKSNCDALNRVRRKLQQGMFEELRCRFVEFLDIA